MSIRDFSRVAFCVVALLSLPGRLAADVKADGPRKLPVILEGGTIEAGERKEASLEKEVILPVPGVWYVWLRAETRGDVPAVIEYALDGYQPLKSARSRIILHPHAGLGWVSYSAYTRYPGFRAQVRVLEGGAHKIKLTTVSGGARVSKIALTPYHSAKPAGDSLDHSGDPGGGRIDADSFPAPAVGGFREKWEAPPLAASVRKFHVDCRKGDDGNNGLTPEKAWRTLARVNSAAFRPGDAVLFRRGCEWTGGLAPRGNGREGAPITIGAWGDGPRPKLNGVDRPAIALRDQSHWVIRDVEATNEQEFGQNGIEAIASPDVPQPRDVRIMNCVVYDTGGSGIQVGSPHGEGNGYDGVVIENCLSFWNAEDGINVGGSDQNGARNAVVRDCTAFGNPGSAGIWIQSCQNGLIERCVAFNNACINIWTWNSVNVTIRRCLAFRGVPPRDAGGFDIDWGSEACTLEDCRTSLNEGVGILLMGHGTGKYRGFPIASRYNVCRNCVSEYSLPAIGMCETFEKGKVYCNVAVARGRDAVALDVGGWPIAPYAEGWSGGWPAETVYSRNVLVGMDGAVPMWIDGSAAGNGNTFDHDEFWRAGGKGPLIKWGGQRNGVGFYKGTDEGRIPPREFADLDSFRKATGWEKNGKQLSRRPKEEVEPASGRISGAAPDQAGERGAPPVLAPEWLAGRRKLLADTGAERYGIPMEPAPDAGDCRDGKVLPAKDSPTGATGP